MESNLTIDYTYLWDIICKKNPLLFPEGLNLIIIDITVEDATDNIKIICPKQTYSDEFLDIKKKSLLLIKKDDYFEPIYLINNTINNYDFTKLFSFAGNKEDGSLKNFKLILNKIRKAININCIHKIDTKKYSSSIYNFKPNISLINVINILIKLKYEITSQIIDYNNKVIGVTIKQETENGLIEKGFIPCYPSALSNTYEKEQIPYKLIDELDTNDYNDYIVTKELLKKIYKLSNYKIVCKPEYKVEDNGAIVGILTLGNQFVRLSEPEQNNDDDLIKIESKDYVYIDKEIQSKYYKNTSATEAINNIKLETLFYNNFKNTFKKLLNININNKKKNDLLRIINNNSMLYLDKLTNIYNVLKSIGEKYIIFSENMEPILNNIKLSSCFDDEKCPSIICRKIDTVCSLIIPKINLINKENNENNEELYYSRLSDEFVRYNKFRNFIFENNNVYGYGSVEYNIINNELLLFQSSLTQEFFKELPTINKDNNYITTFDTFDTLGFENTDKTLNLKNIKKEQSEKIVIELTSLKDKEIIKQNKMFIDNPQQFKTIDELKAQQLEDEDKDDNDDKDDDDDEMKIEDEELELNKNIQLLTNYTDKKYYCSFNSNKITEGFSSNFKTTIHQLRYSLDDKICSFQLILIMIKYHNKEHINLTIEELRTKLISLYKNNNNFESLCIILLKNNKKEIMKQVINKTITFEECLLSKEYYVTYIDIYLLSKEYDLPIILLCNTIIDLTITKEKFIIFNLNRLNNNYFFIKNRSLYDRKKLHNYKLIINASSVDFNIDEDLLDTSEYKLYSEIKNSIANYRDILGDYINNYSLNEKKQIAKLNTKLKKEKEAKPEVKEAEEAVKEEEEEAVKEEEVKEEEAVKEEEEVKEEEVKEEEAEEAVSQTKKIKRERCPNGTRKNKKTGLCEKYTSA